MVERQRRPQRRHGVGEASLVHRDDVHVSLGHDGVSLRRDALLGIVERDQVLALVEHARLARVEVLGLSVPHDAPTKADAAALLVMDGKHHAVVELVTHPPRATRDEVGRLELLPREAGGRELTHERDAGVGKAEVPARADV